MHERLNYRATDSGLREFGNEAILLAGGFLRTGLTPPGTVGAGFVVFDKPALKTGRPPEACHLGKVEIFLLADRLALVHGLVNIEVHDTLRRRGIGRTIVQSIAATTPEGRLEIYDIQADAIGFWISLGCSFRPRPPAWDATYTLPSGSP